MNHKIEETKVQLLALKKEQITTTNRLTVLQNHQLTTELEYQSKQTEKLLFRNNKLNEQIASLKRNIEIHKQVEQELAKRSQNAQKQIKTLSQDIKEIEEKNENLKKERDQLLEPEEHEIMQQKQQEEIIEELEKQLETSEKKYAKVTNDLELLRNEQFYLQSKIENSENKSQNFAQILAHCLENLRNNQPGVYDDLAQKDVEINMDFLEKIRQKDVLEWEQDEKETVIFYLINKVKSLITKKTLLEFSHIPEHLEIEIVQQNDTDANQQNQSLNQTQNQSLFQKYNEYTQQQQDNKTNVIKQFKYNPNSNKNSNTFLPKIQSQGSRNNLEDYNNSLNNDSKNKYNINNSSINNNNQSVNSALNRFKGLPIDVSTQIVKGNVREWGKQAMTMPSNNKKAMQVQRRFKMM
ncbi:hypothetical protein PPERSA_06384 [Pseudocohnilembus persalinus]|uniref:Cilia- and flagella-associated protein 157 n=1 Tax=Pseudocohnilembus persalinus TaxID=266149 RepID=A0A0V0QIW9_PSEPJ|nr:hypothetical protein PPERSA_06384 [Pseudocohnilembus persalinus]|eukprot:KRX02189.1 hypothetical protein PPERSA_06384 [Pseudocohnilembus persalinus]